MDESHSESCTPQTKSARADQAPTFVPRTPLGRRLWELRQKIVESGEPLIDWEDIEQEVQKRRGGRVWPAED
jgi:hypothetical protein